MNAVKQETATKRLVLEGTVIIVSILLAFGIDAWWEERKDRLEEQGILIGLQEEFQLTRDLLTQAKEKLSERVGALEELLLAMEKFEPADVASVSTLFMDAMLAPSTTDLGSGALDALLSSGRVELLENAALRSSLSAWNGVLGEVYDDEQNNSEFIYKQVIPYFVDHGVPVSGAMSQWYPDWSAPARFLADSPEGFTRLLQDPQFRTLAELVHAYQKHGIGEFEAALNAIDEILSEVEASLN